MSTFFMLNHSFSNIGIVIQENINMSSISNSFSVLFGFPLRFHSLSVTFVNVELVPGISGITATGLGTRFPESRLTVGDLDQFLPGSVSSPAVKGFSTLALTAQTTAAQGLVYDINQHELSAVIEQEFSSGDPLSGSSLSFDTQMRAFDFSATGTAALDILMNRVSSTANPGAAGFVPYSDQEVIANNGSNIVYGYSGPGRVDGYTGSNTYRLGGGSDIFLGGDSGDFGEGQEIPSGGGSDQVRVFGGAGNDIIIAGDKDDELFGEGGNDLLFGGGGNDLLVGGAGNDLLYASEGLDTLVGGTGADRFIFANYRYVEFAGPDPGSYLGFYTGLVSPPEAPNRIADFNASQNDLIVFGVDSFFLQSNPDEGSAPFILFPTQASNGSTLWQFESFGSGSSDAYAFSSPAAITLNNTLIQVESFAWSSFNPTLDLATRVLDQNENSRDGSYEIVYGEGGRFGTNLGFIFGDPEVQIYLNLALAPSASTSGPLGGQDKFDLSGLGLVTSGLIFTTLGDEQDFTLYDPSLRFVDQFSSAYVIAANFFQDTTGGDRAIHAEYASFGSEGNTMVVYVDVNGDGDLDTRDDLVFRLDDILLSPDSIGEGFPDFAQELSAGQVDDLFILNQNQYNFWFI